LSHLRPRGGRVATGQPLAKLATIAGRTELDIMRDSPRVNGLDPTDELVDKLAVALTHGYEDARDELAVTGRVLPGARDTLATLAADASGHQAVLSGTCGRCRASSSKSSA
jgi:hypothetical protein